MPSFADSKAVGEQLAGVFALIPALITAGAGNDGVEVDGASIQRTGLSGGPGNSAKFLIPYSTTLADTETLTVAANIQDSPAGSSWTDFGTAFASAVLHTSSGGSTHTGVVELDVDLTAADDYIRIQVTATLSASGTDTVSLGAVAVIGGQQEQPVTSTT